MPWHITSDFETYEKARQEFTWDFPSEYHPARDLITKHPNVEKQTALIDAAAGQEYTFTEINQMSNRLANALSEIGITADDRVGVVSPQRVETPVSHLAIWKLGAITVPMTTMYGTDAIAYRLSDSDAKAVIFDPSVDQAVANAAAECDSLEHAIILDEHQWYDGSKSQKSSDLTYPVKTSYYENKIENQSTEFTPPSGSVTDGSAVMYTSGSTGKPKGALHSHALWLGRAAAAFNFFDGNMDSAAINWTPADWAWGSALGGLLMGSWHYGVTVVAAPMQGFDPEAVYTLLEEQTITNALIPPTALRMLMEESPESYDLSLKTIASAGEPLTPEILTWADETFESLTVNEYYGQTELNLVVSNASRWFEVQPGSMGKPLPGYDVKILDPETYDELPPGEVGEIAVKPENDEVFFDRYINRSQATKEKQHDGWYLTGDHASMDENGYIWFKSRADDVIITSGYRVGPLEVEQVLLKHPAVEQAGVIGIPDQTRGEIIKAYVELTAEAEPSSQLREELQELAKDRLATHEYPREIEFADSLPMTSSGKIQRTKLRENN